MIEYENLAKLNQPYFEEYKNAFSNVLESGWFILGENVKRFEEEFAEYNNMKHCVGVASGLDALILSIKALDIEDGSEIIVPSNTYIATILAIIHSGHVPILVEPNITTYNIDTNKIEEAISSKTKAIMIVHLYGKVCDMDPILDICKRHKLYLIEDCAQAHGAMHQGKKAGSFGDMAAFSFYPTKNLGCLGDGGAVTTNNPIFDEKLRMLRNYGSSKKYYNQYIGYNSRLDEVQAAFLSIKLKHLDEINEHKRTLASIYSKNLKTDFIIPVQEADFFDVFHIYNIRHKQRDDLKAYLLKNNIKTEIHYPVAPNKQIALGFLKHLSFPISEEIHATTLSLPISTFHTKDNIYRVVEVLNKY
ncbi:MAG: DegT/DnrJ/EryC1/StrS family aminotransferase [Bacteroidales bacterium]|nr:DegT/DnrJ/EryC1/StrS family aminotransferase [Bacteroidales bacterium]